MKTVVLLAPHFTPSFLPSAQRARILAHHLPEFGWKPIVLTTDPRYYDSQVDPDLVDLLPSDLEVVTARALPTRAIGVRGDVGLRSLPWYYDAVRRLAAKQRIDFLLITIPSNMAALVGPAVERRLGIPYGIDYQDPWVPETPQGHRLLSKAWIAEHLGQILEPIAVRRARLITGINSAYFSSVLVRNPELRSRVVTADLPFGHAEQDYDALRRKPRPAFLFDGARNRINVVYTGALLPKAFAVLERLLAALVLLRGRNPELASQLRVHFVGTGLFKDDPTRGHQVLPLVEQHGLEDMVAEVPQRIRYLDVLNHLGQSDAVLIVGSTESHYAPSKVYAAVMARRPLFALLHEESGAVETLRRSGAGEVFTFTADRLPDPARLSAAFEQFLASRSRLPGQLDMKVFDRLSGRESGRTLAAAMDRALASVAAAAA